MSRNDTTTFYPVDGTGQSVSYTGTAGVITTAFAAQTRHVMLWTTTDAHIKFGAAPTATTSDLPIPGNVPMVFACRPGEKISAIQVSTGGTLYVGELTT